MGSPGFGMLGDMNELEWVIIRPKDPDKRRRSLIQTRSTYEHRLTGAEPSVGEIGATKLKGNALACFAPNPSMLGGTKDGGGGS